MSEILAAAITAFCALCGTALTVFLGNRKNSSSILKNTDVIIYRLNRVEEKVDTLFNMASIRSSKKYQPIIRQYSAVE